jgi:hypothetical protein
MAMGWEKRPGGVYFYKSIRTDDGPRKMYCGIGPIGKAHAIRDRQLARQKAPARSEREYWKRLLTEGDEHWSVLWAWLRVLADAYLITSGWYRHKGERRLARRKPRTRQKRVQATPVPEGDLQAKLKALTVQANAGVAGALEQLQKCLQKHPEVSQVVDALNQQLIDFLADKIVEGKLYPSNAISEDREWDHDPVGPTTPPIERALIDAVTVVKLLLDRAQLHLEKKVVAEPKNEFWIYATRMKRVDAVVLRLRATHNLLKHVQTMRRTQEFANWLETPPAPEIPVADFASEPAAAKTG